ncbi:hypothetical protein BDR26DRAFT_851457 [Obelidium mucronatum]|nr:hypothetical protein BDR26DRAFT_851457 [Obelidium mucronatum]
MSLTAVSNIAIFSNVTASSFDNVSAKCLPNLCKPQESVDDGHDVPGMDDTQWISLPVDATSGGANPCPTQWIQYDFTSSGPKSVYNVRQFQFILATMYSKVPQMSIQYDDNHSFTFDGQPEGSVTRSPIVTVTLFGNSNPIQAVQGTDYTFTSTVQDEARFDAFTPVTDLLKNDIKSIRFTWDKLQPVGGKKAPNACEVRVDETMIYGTASKSAQSPSNVKNSATKLSVLVSAAIMAFLA